MDRIRTCGVCDGGSTPPGGTSIVGNFGRKHQLAISFWKKKIFHKGQDSYLTKK